MTMQRREFLGLGALAASGALLDARVAFAHPDSGRSRLVLVIMRGALDGLAAVPALGDRDYPELRREFALRAPGEVGGALPLDGFFGLHPALAFMQQCYAAREAGVSLGQNVPLVMRGAARGAAPSARLSQPVCNACGYGEPLSSTSCPSKCERSR